MTRRSSPTPTSIVTTNARGTGSGQVPIEVRRETLFEQRLHRVSHIGADHEHLAVGHVDDPHQTEGDGETERGEQEHAGEADAVHHVAHHADEALAVLDRRERPCASVSHLLVGF